MPHGFATGLGFIIVPAGFNAPLGFESRYSGTGISNGAERNLHLLKEVVKFLVSERGLGILDSLETIGTRFLLNSCLPSYKLKMLNKLYMTGSSSTNHENYPGLWGRIEVGMDRVSSPSPPPSPSRGEGDTGKR